MRKWNYWRWVFLAATVITGAVVWGFRDGWWGGLWIGLGFWVFVFLSLYITQPRVSK